MLIDPARVAAHPAVRAGDVLDVRPAVAFARGHLRGAMNWPLPADGVGTDRLAGWLPGHRLPPRHAPLLVVGEEPAATAAVVTFLRRGGRWADGVVWTAAVAREWPVTAEAGRPALCRPDPYLASHANLLPPPAMGPVLDCGCGSGRNAVWLARRGYAVTAVDRDPDALARLRDLAAAYGVTVTPRRADLADPAQVPPGPWSLLVAVRYLERSLLRRAPALLRPGGVVVVRTFRWAGDLADRLPRRRFCLAPGELARLLPSPPFRYRHCGEDTDPDGRPAAGIVAWLAPPPCGGASGQSST